MSSSANKRLQGEGTKRINNLEQRNALSKKQWISLGLSLIIFISVYYGLPGIFHSAARTMMAIVACGMVFWITEALPIGVTAILIMVLMLLLHPVPMDTVYSGFASPAVFLVTGGMMLARAVGETRLTERLTYFIVAKWGGSAKGLLASIIIIPQIQGFFIPSSGVRSALLLPFTKNILNQVGARERSPLRRMIYLAVAYAGTLSATPVITGAVGNILTVTMIQQILHIKITFVQWLIYALPLWLIMIPITWLVLLMCFPLEDKEKVFPSVAKEMTSKLKAFGPFDRNEKKCLAILTLIIALWLTEPLHGLDPSIPLLMGVLLMVFPGIGCASWANVVNINFNTILVLAATLSMGYALNDSGAAHDIGQLLQAPAIMSVMHHKYLAIALIILITQVVHLIMSNVTTAVVTLIPIVITLAQGAGLDPVVMCVIVSLTCLHGYILIVEALPNMIAYSTGELTQRDFLVPGLYLTLGMMVVLFIIAVTYWQWIGFTL